MEKDQLSRKLAVILHADVIGSIALVRYDETLAQQGVQNAFQHFSKIIINHDGVAHKIRGDALVAEFAKVSDALAASIASIIKQNVVYFNVEIEEIYSYLNSPQQRGKTRNNRLREN